MIDGNIHAADIAENALGRRLSGYTRAMMRYAVTITAPPPMPCRPRPTISSGRLAAKPQVTEPSKKQVIPATRGPRGPRASPQSPETTIENKDATVYALNAQV